MSTLFTLGAYDRFNYGDLLFPLVLESLTNTEIRHLALVDSDLGALGARPTEAIRRIEFGEGDSLVVAGGDVLTSNWYGATWQLRDAKSDFIFRIGYRTIPHRQLEEIFRRRFGSKWKSPYVVPPQISSKVPTAYNAVGGSDLGLLPKHSQNAIAESLSYARYVSVRDMVTYANLNQLGISSHLVPDSVASNTRILEKNGDVNQHQLVIQTSSHWMRANLKIFAEQLISLRNQGWEIGFLPIGVAGGHSDLDAYRRLSTLVPDVTLLPFASLKDVYEGIVNAGIFIGTSLHGHITAINANRPTVALPGIAKLSSYVQTWTNSVTSTPSHVSDLKSAVEETLQVSPNLRLDLSEELSIRAREGTQLALESVS